MLKQSGADAHELDPERAVGALCLVYGRDSGRYEALIGKDLIEARADGCPFEYRQELRPGEDCSPQL